eukprot:15692305-Heterocapsa_arctica.AAC.1
MCCFCYVFAFVDRCQHPVVISQRVKIRQPCAAEGQREQGEQGEGEKAEGREGERRLGGRGSTRAEERSRGTYSMKT